MARDKSTAHGCIVCGEQIRGPWEVCGEACLFLADAERGWAEQAERDRKVAAREVELRRAA